MGPQEPTFGWSVEDLREGQVRPKTEDTHIGHQTLRISDEDGETRDPVWDEPVEAFPGQSLTRGAIGGALAFYGGVVLTIVGAVFGVRYLRRRRRNRAADAA